MKKDGLVSSSPYKSDGPRLKTTNRWGGLGVPSVLWFNPYYLVFNTTVADFKPFDRAVKVTAPASSPALKTAMQ